MLLGMRDADYEPDQIAAYGASEQPAIAARMAPHLRMTVIGTGCALLAVIAAAGAVVLFPSFSADDPGVGWAITSLAAALLMLADLRHPGPGMAPRDGVLARTADSGSAR